MSRYSTCVIRNCELVTNTASIAHVLSKMAALLESVLASNFNYSYSVVVFLDSRSTTLSHIFHDICALVHTWSSLFCQGITKSGAYSHPVFWLHFCLKPLSTHDLQDQPQSFLHYQLDKCSVPLLFSSLLRAPLRSLPSGAVFDQQWRWGLLPC